MTYIDDGLAVIMANQPDSFTAASVTKPCSFMLHDQTMQQGHIGAGQQAAMAHALVKTSDFPALKRGDAVSVNGTNYSVLLPTRIQDGTVTQVFLGKA
jgi:hypothetical protein